MKKILVIILICFLFNFVSAVEFNMKSDFGKGETLFAKISGNFVDSPLKENVFFYRGHVNVPMEFDLGKIDGDYYIYAQLPETSGNFSIEIQNVKYYSGTKIIEENLVKNFSISDLTADFSVEPGFVITDGNFFVQLQNLKDSKITVNVKTSTTSGVSGGFFASLFGTDEIEDNSENSFTLKSGEIKDVNFEIKNLDENSLKTIEFSSGNLTYEIPVYVLKNASEKKQTREFKFEPSGINVKMSTDSEAKRIFYLHNTGEESLNNITLTLSESFDSYVTLSFYEIDELGINESVKIEMDISSDSDEKIIEGQFKAKAEPNLYAYASLSFDFIKDFVPENDTYVPETTETCAELNGKICSETQECDIEEIPAKDTMCCLGNCTERSSGSTGKIIGGAIIVLIVLFSIWFYKKKYKGTEKRKVDLLKISEGKK